MVLQVVKYWLATLLAIVAIVLIVDPSGYGQPVFWGVLALAAQAPGMAGGLLGAAVPVAAGTDADCTDRGDLGGFPPGTVGPAGRGAVGCGAGGGWGCGAGVAGVDVGRVSPLDTDGTRLTPPYPPM